MKHKYKINEIFYSIQAEGANAGKPAVFVRFSGCNLHCPWCDTPNHNEGVIYTGNELEKIVKDLSAGDTENIIVVLTGGEPTLQLHDDEQLFEDFFVAIETNGTKPVPWWIDYVTCSPKTDVLFDKIKYSLKPDEIKVVYQPEREEYFNYLKGLKDVKLFIQPLENGGKMNIPETMNYLLKNPQYRLSLQFHKLIGVR